MDKTVVFFIQNLKEYMESGSTDLTQVARDIEELNELISYLNDKK